MNIRCRWLNKKLWSVTKRSSDTTKKQDAFEKTLQAQLHKGFFVYISPTANIILNNT